MRILNVKTEGVLRGVLTGELAQKPDLIEVTFEDYNHVPHTVYAHKQGQFTTPQDIAQAWFQGVLTDEPADPAPAAPAPAGPFDRG